MIESMVKSLIAYGLSRESGFSDQDFADHVVAYTRDNNYHFSALLKAFVTQKSSPTSAQLPLTPDHNSYHTIGDHDEQNRYYPSTSLHAGAGRFRGDLLE